MEAYSPERADAAAPWGAETNVDLAAEEDGSVIAITDSGSDYADTSLDVSRIRDRISHIFRTQNGVEVNDYSEPGAVLTLKKRVEAINAGRSMNVRPAMYRDLERLVEVDMQAFRSVYRHYDVSLTELKADLFDKFQQRFERVGSKWIAVLEKDKQVVGFLTACPTSKPPEDFVSWEDTTDSGTLASTYDPDGKYLYAVSLSVVPEGSKLAGQDMLMVDLISKVIEGDYTAYFESRLPGLKRWMHRRCREGGSTLDSLSEAQKQTYAEDYFRLNTQFLPGDKPIDPLLKIYHAMGAYFPRLVPNAYQDELSMNYGVVAVYENPLPSFLNKSPKLRKSAALAVRGISRSHYLTKRIF